MTKPKITVIIPTRERCDVLQYALRTVTSQDYDNLEILVSDNCSTDETINVVHAANDSRIRYINTGKRLSMSHNWEFALSHVDDGWVTFMGDDDGLLPEALNTVACIIASTRVKAIRSPSCMYQWPATAGNRHGKLIVPMGSRRTMRDAKQWLHKVIRGTTKYPQLPLIYNGGFVEMSVLRNIRERTGNFIRSCNPDLYLAVAIASMIDRFVYTDIAVSIDGVSRHSNGHSWFSAEADKNIAPREKFLSEENIPFHRDMPTHEDGTMPISFHAMVYETYLQSSDLRDVSDGPDQRQQLEIILATAGAHRESIGEWGRLFAEQHGIDLPAAMHSAALKRTWLQPLHTMRKLTRAMHTTFSSDLPIRNIHEASIAAGVIRANPGKMGTVRFLADELRKRLT